jgi:transcriptional regulator with XRE-family HTH domain
MARRKREEVRGYWALTANQVVAYNLARARELRGWTQERAAEAIAPYLGLRWSKASFSQAERSLDGRNARQFDATEIIAFARGFDLPIGWFYFPPLPWDGGLPRGRPSVDIDDVGPEVMRLVDLIFGTAEHQHLLEDRLREFGEALGPQRFSEAQKTIAEAVQDRIRTLSHAALHPFGDWTNTLRAIADQLDAARATTADEIDDRGDTR